MRNQRQRCIVVGVTGQQPDAVLRQAARFARQFEAVLVCGHVDPGSYVVSEHPDGTIESRPIDPDQPHWDSVVFDPALADRIRALAREEHVEVVFRALAGDVGHALGRLAETLEAQMLVVGSRRGGLKTSMHDSSAGPSPCTWCTARPFPSWSSRCPRCPPAHGYPGRATGERGRPSAAPGQRPGSRPRRGLARHARAPVRDQHRPRCCRVAPPEPACATWSPP